MSIRDKGLGEGVIGRHGQVCSTHPRNGNEEGEWENKGEERGPIAHPKISLLSLVIKLRSLARRFSHPTTV